MKKIYTLLALVMYAVSALAQCTVEADIQTNGNEVTVTILGNGAVSPMYGIIWGDGSESTTQTATHVYEIPGTYEICYVYVDIANLENCNQTDCQQVIITGEGCSMNFIPMTLGLSVGLQINSFGASAPSYTINWGDGSPVETGDNTNHTYEADGTYNICVTLTDLDNPDNCALLQCEQVVVSQSTGACSVSLSTTVDGSMVQAVATGEGALSANYIITWGDDQFDMTSSATHNYTTTGEFEICVVYGDFGPEGCSATDCETVLIEDLGSCSLELTPVVTGMIVVLGGTASGATTPEYSVEWDDGSTGNTFPDVHTYATPGTYQICVSYVDLDNLENCQVVSCVDVVVEESTSECTVEMVLTMDNNTATVTSTGSGATSPLFVILWGDGSTPTNSDNGSHTFTTSGTYQICVLYGDAADPLTCNTSDCEDVTITVNVNEVILGENAISVLPNPMNDESSLSIQMGKPAHVQADIFDMTGKLVLNIFNGERGQGKQNMSFNSANLASGVYFLRVKANEEERTIKVVR